MEYLTNLKSILHSKRANLYYLEKCRVMVKDGRVVYLSQGKTESQYWNIPIANTTVLLLGNGTSLTQAAVRLLASAGVLVGFTGGGGTPLLAGTPVQWMTPESEYRPTEYVQGWLRFWFDDQKRLVVAKQLQSDRLSFLLKVWSENRDFQQEGIFADDMEIEAISTSYSKSIQRAKTTGELLTIEASMTKQLYKYVAKRTGFSGFVRERENAIDAANIFLNHGNYLAYGLAATVLWVLGIPHGFAVMHGKTRRGALVFDVADLIKDAIVLPTSFISAKAGSSENEFRETLLQSFTKYKAMDFLFDRIKDIALAHSSESLL